MVRYRVGCRSGGILREFAGQEIDQIVEAGPRQAKLRSFTGRKLLDFLFEIVPMLLNSRCLIYRGRDGGGGDIARRGGHDMERACLGLFLLPRSLLREV